MDGSVGGKREAQDTAAPSERPETSGREAAGGSTEEWTRNGTTGWRRRHEGQRAIAQARHVTRPLTATVAPASTEMTDRVGLESPTRRLQSSTYETST